MRLTDETVYILVQRLNTENKGEVDKDIIMSVYKTEESAMKSKENAERRNKELWTGEDVYEVKPYRVWK